MSDQQIPGADRLTGLDSDPSSDGFPARVEVLGNGAAAPEGDPDDSGDSAHHDAIGELRREREAMLQQLLQQA